MRILKTVSMIAECAFLFAVPLLAQSRAANCDPSLGLAQMKHTQPKGRLQDAGAPQTVHIVELENKAIPMLIAWPVTTVGDIAFFYLCDLFTDYDFITMSAPSTRVNFGCSTTRSTGEGSQTWLHRTHSVRRLQCRQTTAGAHQQGQYIVALLAGRSSASSRTM
jgi:hypothetical protein